MLALIAEISSVDCSSATEAQQCREPGGRARTHERAPDGAPRPPQPWLREAPPRALLPSETAGRV